MLCLHMRPLHILRGFSRVYTAVHCVHICGGSQLKLYHQSRHCVLQSEDHVTGFLGFGGLFCAAEYYDAHGKWVKNGG